MASPNETAVLRHVLEMAQASKYRLARVMAISAEYAETMLRGLQRKGWLALGRPPPGSNYDVYKLTPAGGNELLDVLGSLRRRESDRTERAAVRIRRLDQRTAECTALMEQQELMPHQPAGEKR